MDNFHKIAVTGRKEIEISGVSDVNSYNEEEIDIKTNNGNLIITGKNFNVKKLDVESGIMIIEGIMDSLVYSDEIENGDGFFKRFFK